MKNLRWLVLAAVFGAASPAWGFENICPYAGQNQRHIAEILRMDFSAVPRLAAHFCANVGRRAHNALGSEQVRATDLGPILGVAWVNAGDTISAPGYPVQRVPLSGFMYMIGAGGIADHLFLRWASEIAGR
jgi:hypothetical protein